MIFADIQGKLGAEGQRAHERSEDLLTSTAFGLLRYLPFDKGVGALLRRARVVELDGDGVRCSARPEWLQLSGGLTMEFWPRLRTGGQPDLRLRLNHGAEIVLIEVKLFSGKSAIAAAETGEGNAAADEDQGREGRIDPDQLVRYWKGQAAELPSGGRVSIIYLTAHGVPPSDDLVASLSREPTLRLAWLSWRDVWAVADEANPKTDEPDPAADLAALLRHKGLFEFNGFADIGPVPSVPTTGKFWKESSGRFSPDGPLFAGTLNVGARGWADLQGKFFQPSRERS